MTTCTTECEDREIREFYRGTNRKIQVTLTTVPSGQSDITGSKLWFSVKDDEDSTTILIEKKNLAAGGSDSQINIVDGPNRIFEIYLVPADTASVEAGNYRWDVKIEFADGKRYQAVKPARFEVLQPVTPI